MCLKQRIGTSCMDDLAKRRSTQTPWLFSVLVNGRPGPKILGGKETRCLHKSAVIIMTVKFYWKCDVYSAVRGGGVRCKHTGRQADRQTYRHEGRQAGRQA